MIRHVLQGCMLVLLVFVPVAASADQSTFLVERQELTLKLVPERHLIIGESRFYLPRGLRKVRLGLVPIADVTSVSTPAGKVPFVFDRGVLSADLPADREGPLTVSYRAVFADEVAEHPASSEDPTYGVNATITEKGTFLGSGSGWYPVPVTIPARRTVTIEAPAGVEAITAGRRTQHESGTGYTRSTWEETHPVGELSLSAGNYRIMEKSFNGIELYTYFYPDNASLAPGYLQAAERYLRFYVDLFGPYPFEKFAVVENFFPTGYGLPSYTLLGSTVIRLPFIIDTSFPHEIAHSWWGNAIDVDPAQGNWCEGLVTYLADYLLKEKRSLGEAEQYRRQILADFAQLVTPERDFPLSRFTSRVDPASRAIGYGKAAMVFHMVRTRIGDRAFFGALREVARSQMYRSAAWSDFIAAFTAASGADQGPFMNQWLTRTRGPRLSLVGVEERSNSGAWIVEGKILQQQAPYRDLQVPLRLEGKGLAKTAVVRLDGAGAKFEMKSDWAPKRLLLDPAADLFRLLDPTEVPATVNSIKGSRKVFGVRGGGCKATAETFRSLLDSLDQRKAEVIGEDLLDAKMVAESDLVFCGMPSDRDLAGPLLSDKVEVADGGFTVEGKTFRGPDNLLFMVIQRPQGRHTALFLPESAEAAEKYAYKITHYGKFGYLVFSEGVNRLKGGLPPSAGSSTVVFDQP